MNGRKAVITGLGVVSPAGKNAGEFFQNLLAGKKYIKEIERFDSSRYPSRHAGQIDGLGADEVFSKRLIKKLDRFSHLALLAADEAIHDSMLDLSVCDMDRVGIILGNALGGWAFAEEELRELHVSGVREVSPYQATAWFPAAPQGQVSIHYGIKGFSKTIISDIASSHLAIGYAARAVMTGKADIILAGGAEAPISPYALLCCNTSGELSRTGNYSPFGRARDGYVIGEGAGILVVEEYERAKKRGARIYAEVAGFGHTSDGTSPTEPEPDGKGMTRAMRIALDGAGLDEKTINYIMPSGNGGRSADASEARALDSIFDKGLYNGLSIGVPKSLFGNLLGASGAVDAVAACMSMDKGTAPTSTSCPEPEDEWKWAMSNGACVRKEIKNVMINSIGRGGVNASLVLKKVG